MQFSQNIFQYNLAEDFLARYFVVLGVANTVGSGCCSGSSSGVGISIKFFIGSSLLSKSLRTHSLPPLNNLTLFKKIFFNQLISITKEEYGFAVHFFYRLIKSLKSLSD